MPNVWTCPDPACGRKWSGTVSCHCTVCHRHFSTVKNFDAHEPRVRGGRPACKDPATLTRTKKNGESVRVLKPVEELHGVTWVSFTEDVRYAAGAAS